MKYQEDLRFRQVHLDFHTSPAIPGIGEKFDKKQWQEQLQIGHVNSITCFACCHHGWSYHPTTVGAMHPGLKFNLLREQIDACHEIGVKVPIYLTAGLNNRIAELHPGWREINPQGELAGWAKSPLEAGFKKLCFNSPYLDYLCELIAEAAQLFPDADGMFFDIISQGQCCCPACLRDMKKLGYDPENAADRERFAVQTLQKYLTRATAAAHVVHPDWPVFHNNSELLAPGNRNRLPYFSHLEVESLPTGGWGYDHFPLLAAYCRTLDHEFLGMTGKFHTTWGEFGGFKHPNALRYECSAMLAQGAKCSIGDQLHPSGQLDVSTYKLIGAAYREVEAKEPWCHHVKSAATVGILSNAAFGDHSSEALYSEIGVSRLLLEGHIPFDRLDAENDFSRYRVLILADTLRPDAALRARLEKFLASGGKLILSGDALLQAESTELAWNLPLTDCGCAEKFPNYIVADSSLQGQITTPFVMYRPSRQIKLTSGQSLGDVYEPYFNRSYEHFSSHQHTPNEPEKSGFQAGVRTEQILYFAHPVFKLYALYGTVLLKEYILNAIKLLAIQDVPLTTNLPSAGRVSLLEQPSEHRYIGHLLYANPVLRGLNSAPVAHLRRTMAVEVIEELNPVYDVAVTFQNLAHPIKKITLEPQGEEVPFQDEGGQIRLTLPKLICHQMVVLHY